MKIRPVGAELFYADRRTDMGKLFAILWTHQKADGAYSNHLAEELRLQSYGTWRHVFW